jgi:hypothetical protein
VVSVRGEFERVVGECVAFLRSSRASGAERLSAALEAAAREARGDLCRGAEGALAVLAGAEPPVFGSALQREEYARLGDHLAAVCRVILGR